MEDIEKRLCETRRLCAGIEFRIPLLEGKFDAKQTMENCKSLQSLVSSITTDFVCCHLKMSGVSGKTLDFFNLNRSAEWHFNQCLNILILNSFKAFSKRVGLNIGLFLCIRVIVIAPVGERGKVCIKIIDNGIGFPGIVKGGASSLYDEYHHKVSKSSESTDESRSSKSTDESGSSKSTDESGSSKSTDESRSSKSTDESGSSKSTDESRSSKSTDESGSSKSTDESGSSKSTDESRSSKSTDRLSWVNRRIKRLDSQKNCLKLYNRKQFGALVIMEFDCESPHSMDSIYQANLSITPSIKENPNDYDGCDNPSSAGLDSKKDQHSKDLAASNLHNGSYVSKGGDILLVYHYTVIIQNRSPNQDWNDSYNDVVSSLDCQSNRFKGFSRDKRSIGNCRSNALDDCEVDRRCKEILNYQDGNEDQLEIDGDVFAVQKPLYKSEHEAALESQKLDVASNGQQNTSEDCHNDVDELLQSSPVMVSEEQRESSSVLNVSENHEGEQNESQSLPASQGNDNLEIPRKPPKKLGFVADIRKAWSSTKTPEKLLISVIVIGVVLTSCYAIAALVCNRIGIAYSCACL